LNDITVFQREHEFFFVVLDCSEFVLWEHFESIVGLAIGRINFVNAEFALSELFGDVEGFWGSGRMIKDNR